MCVYVCVYMRNHRAQVFIVNTNRGGCRNLPDWVIIFNDNNDTIKNNKKITAAKTTISLNISHFREIN